jgi:hypothetical protein
MIPSSGGASHTGDGRRAVGHARTIGRRWYNHWQLEVLSWGGYRCSLGGDDLIVRWRCSHGRRARCSYGWCAVLLHKVADVAGRVDHEATGEQAEQLQVRVGMLQDGDTMLPVVWC